jgi:hypothetical protein
MSFLTAIQSALARPGGQKPARNPLSYSRDAAEFSAHASWPLSEAVSNPHKLWRRHAIPPRVPGAVPAQTDFLAPPIGNTFGCGSSTTQSFHLAHKDQTFASRLHLRDRAGRQAGTALHPCPQRDRSTAAVHRCLTSGHATYAYGLPRASGASPRHSRAADQRRSSAAHLGETVGFGIAKCPPYPGKRFRHRGRRPEHRTPEEEQDSELERT